MPPEPFAAVRRVVEEELGGPLERTFLRFDEAPLAAASIAQVHAATLASGEEVVVKVQRPRVRERVAFLRLMMTGAVNDLRGQLEAFRDLGALREDADLEAIAELLRIDQPVVDPTRLSSEELVDEIQRVVKGLLAQGARLPKPLMLYVKGMLFFDGAIAAMAPDIDLFEELARIYAYFAARHGERIRRDVGFDPAQAAPDAGGLRASLGLEAGVERITPRELQRRREILRERLEEAGSD